MPRRRCVGCGRIAPKSELLRFAVAREPGTRRLAVHDADGSLPGRGAYLCAGADPAAPANACLALAIRRSGIGRGLRASVSLDPKLLELVSR